MEIAGRIVSNATVNELKDGRQVINFSIVVNNSYKVKGENNFTEVATFFNCSYWRNPRIAQYLTKGKLAQVYGRISINVYTNAEGEARGSLQFHVNEIKFLSGVSNKEQRPVAEQVAVSNEDDKEDLPF